MWFVDFLKDNILGCIIVILILILLILLLVLLPKRFNKYWSSMLEVIPLFIVECENNGIVGSSNKLNYVVGLCISYLSSVSGIKESVLNKRFHDLVVLEVEKILSTPQKKGE